MGYGARDLVRIKLGICLDCKRQVADRYRRCLGCRKRRRTKPSRDARLRARLERATLSYTAAKEKGKSNNGSE